MLSFFEVARCLGIVSGIFTPVALCPHVLEISKMVYFSTPLCFLPLGILFGLCFFDSRVWSHVPRVPGREDVYRVKCDSTLASYSGIMRDWWSFLLYSMFQNFLLMGFIIGGVEVLKLNFDETKNHALFWVAAPWATAIIIENFEEFYSLELKLRRKAIFGSIILIVGFLVMAFGILKDHYPILWCL